LIAVPLKNMNRPVLGSPFSKRIGIFGFLVAEHDLGEGRSCMAYRDKWTPRNDLAAGPDACHARTGEQINEGRSPCRSASLIRKVFGSGASRRFDVPLQIVVLILSPGTNALHHESVLPENRTVAVELSFAALLAH